MIRQIGSRWKGAATAVAVTGVALTLATSGALAQDESATATPAVETVVTDGNAGSGTGSATVNVEQGAVAVNGASAFDKTQLTEAIQKLTDTIAFVQKDRDAVASSIDVTEIDVLLAKATELRDAAKSTLQTDDVSSAPQSIFTGLQSASAAHGLIEAGVSAYGLPSQQARASRVLVQAYYTIDDASSSLKPDADANATFYTESAKRLYTKAYELYNGGTYAQAEKTAAVAQQIALIGNPALGKANAEFITPEMKIEHGYGAGNAESAVATPDGDKGANESGVVVRGGETEPAMKGDEPADKTKDGHIEGDEPANVEIALPPYQDGVMSGAVVGPHFELIPGAQGGFRVPYTGTEAIAGPSFSSGIVFSLSGLDASATPLEVPAPIFD